MPDEVAIAGGVDGKLNKTYYLYNGSGWWTSSPRYSNVYGGAEYIVNTDGSLYGCNTHYTNRLRPVINLTSTAITGGKGTSLEPFTVN